jgi:hypothetical protein
MTICEVLVVDIFACRPVNRGPWLISNLVSQLSTTKGFVQYSGEGEIKN